MTECTDTQRTKSKLKEKNKQTYSGQNSIHPIFHALGGFPGSSGGKESTCTAGDASSIPEPGRSPGEAIGYHLQYSWASLVAQMERICLQCGRPGFDPWVGTIFWRRERLPTPVFLPGEVHEQWSLAGYSPWGCKESDTTEQLWLFMH